MDNQSGTSHELIPSGEHPGSHTQRPDDSLAVSIMEMLERLSPLSPHCWIYRVNFSLRQVNQKAYTPKVVSVGPLHWGRKELQSMEEHKLRYLQAFLRLTNLSMVDCVYRVRTYEVQARSYYAETLEQTCDEFVRMILVDGCFVVMVLVLNYSPQLIQVGDRLFYSPGLIDQVIIDMLLLENQLPFFVIEDLYNLFTSSTNQRILELPSIRNLVYELFQGYIVVLKPPKDNGIPRVSHFVDFIRFLYKPTLQIIGDNSNAILLTPNATHLHAAGVKFESVARNSPMDIEFAHGVLKIPHLVIDDNTEVIFRNLLAFELLHTTDKYLSSYLCLLDKLIDTPNDVDLLIKAGVIRNFLGSSEDVCKLFNNIWTHATLGSKAYFSCIGNDLNAYCKTPWHEWKAALKRDYLNTPWKVMGIIVAFFLLVLTFMQTVCSILSL